MEPQTDNRKAYTPTAISVHTTKHLETQSLESEPDKQLKEELQEQLNQAQQEHQEQQATYLELMPKFRNHLYEAHEIRASMQ